MAPFRRAACAATEDEMSEITRFGVSMDDDLLTRFDRLCKRRKYQNRSEALRDLVRDALVREQWESDEEIVGTITLVYDHHTRELGDSLTQVQHDHFDAILSNLHVHLDHENCLEVIAVRGKASMVQKVADSLIAKRGVKHGMLSATTSGKRLK
jgi:CopG family nickel-responsive transcriptional regulator